jgi:pimeloyl-ACP methyl ester carboxylesterase
VAGIVARRCGPATVNAAEAVYRTLPGRRTLSGMNATSSAEQQREPMKISESGSGRNILVLHGGGGPATMTGLVAHLAEQAHVITPTHPGWNGTARPESIHSIAALADAYVRYLEEHDVKDVVLLGSSIGGWIGAEIALRDTAHRVAGLVIVNGVGVNVPGQTITDISRFTPPEIARVAFHDPANFGKGAPPPTPELIAMARANMATLMALSGDPYGYDPTLLGRLTEIRVPTLVLWGVSDRVVTKEYGLAYSAAIPGATFETVEAAGHLPWLEQPAETFRRIDAFVAAVAARAHG